MPRLLLLLALIGLALWVFRDRGRSRRGPPRGTGAAPELQKMIACAHCGVHLPSGEALGDAAGRAYCSESHRLAGPR